MLLTCAFMPTLKEAAPPAVYIANLVLLFLYQVSSSSNAIHEQFLQYLYLSEKGLDGYLPHALCANAQTLDAIDGKQARRTNTSSPLGQLFDHGCDSFSTVGAET